MNKIRVILADDHTVVRAGIRSMIENLAEIEIVGQASNGREALQLVEKIQPDVLVTDISMPEMNGFEATLQITKAFPKVRVLILSMHTSEEYVFQALRSGATGYLLKDADAQEVEVAIRAVAGGATYLTPSVSKHVVEAYMQRLGCEVTMADVLTARQREILQFITEGNALKVIASKLGLSVKTVETHRVRLMDRLQIFDVPGLVRYAIRNGIIPPDTNTYRQG
ncbi:MAG: response regulator transcription factor [Planctomycetaceae bacterium]